MMPFTAGVWEGLDALNVAQMVQAAYGGRASLQTFLDRNGLGMWTIVRVYPATDKFTGCAFLRHAGMSNTIIVIVAGMSTGTHALSIYNGWTSPEDWDNVGIVNRFFKRAADVIKFGAGFEIRWEGAKVLVVGHSAGGAIAECLFNSSIFKQRAAVAEILTFGAPKVAVALQAGCVPDWYGTRVFNEDDPVPLLPGQQTMELDNAFPLGNRLSNKPHTWCHARQGVSLSAYGKFSASYIPRFSVGDVDSIKNMLPLWGVGGFPNHSIAEYVRRIRLAVYTPSEPTPLVIERPKPETVQVAVVNGADRRVFPMARAVEVAPDAMHAVLHIERGHVSPGYRMKTWNVRNGERNIRWMARSVARVEGAKAGAFPRMWNRILARMCSSGTWYKKALDASLAAFLDAASTEGNGVAEPVLRAE